MAALEKELTNNRIKLMNMKTDFTSMKKLVQKIEVRSQSQQAQRVSNPLAMAKKRTRRGINSSSKQRNQFGHDSGLADALMMKKPPYDRQ